MATVEKMPMLQEGYELITAELQRLKLERPEVIDAIEEARAQAISPRMRNIMPPRSARARSRRASPIWKTG
jgi:hypothetical protein